MSSFFFSLFSKTETKEGKSLMMNWVMYPLSDLDMIRKKAGGCCVGCFYLNFF